MSIIRGELSHCRLISINLKLHMLENLLRIFLAPLFIQVLSELVLTIVADVIAGIILYFVCKWLDGKK